MTGEAPRVVVMGPSGSGKSVVGAALADDLGVGFVDADSLHPPTNVAKMAAGVPLTDADRLPWLRTVGRAIADSPGGLVVACSALRRSYRELLGAEAPGTVFVALRIEPGELHDRVAARHDHFMPVALLDSQLAAFEPLAVDEPGVTIDNVGPIDEVVARARHGVETLGFGR